MKTQTIEFAIVTKNGVVPIYSLDVHESGD